MNGKKILFGERVLRIYYYILNFNFNGSFGYNLKNKKRVGLANPLGEIVDS
jgi:hypothetical protein